MKTSYILTRVLCAFVLAVAAFSCGPKGDDRRDQSGSNDSGPWYGDPGGTGAPTGPGEAGPQEFERGDLNFLHLDLTDASALVTFEDSSSALTAESVKPMTVEPKNSVGSGIQQIAGLLYRITRNGAFRHGLRSFPKESDDAFDENDTDGIDVSRLRGLPHISYVAISPCGEIYIAFEHHLLFRNKAKIDGSIVNINDYPDPWSNTSPFTCQLFKVKQKVGAYTAASDRIQRSNLECISHTYDAAGNFINKLELNTYDFRSGQIKFDDSCNLYFTAHAPGNWKNVLIRRANDTGKLSEGINANVCFRDYLITGAGGILYTGNTSTAGECSGTGFFRYVTPAPRLFEVTRGWWEYEFEPITSGIDEGKILFYGPNTVTSTIPSWNTACLYKFDPNATDDPNTTDVDERTTRVAACQSDFGGYVNDPNITVATRKTRCTQTDYYLNSGETPKDIVLADVDANGTEEIYYIGKIQKKKAGQFYCDVAADGAHCYSAGNNGEIPESTLTTQGTCEAAGKQWRTNPYTYGNRSGTDCELSADPWTVSFGRCENIGDWSSTYSALARINADSTITRMSGDNEDVNNIWVIERDDKKEVYYSGFTTGIYSLYRVGTNSNKRLLYDFEVTKVTRDPAANSTLLFLNGLDFTNNSFVVGTFDPDHADPESTLDTETELTGKIDTIIILPE